jgi:steroid delta-isomerase
MRERAIMAVAILFAGVLPGTPSAWAADDPADMIRTALELWRDDFNARRSDRICDLFAPDLRYDFQGLPEQDFGRLCDRLRRVLGNNSQSYRYGLVIKETIVSGDLAVVCLTWTSTFTNENGRQVTEDEPGLDVFRRHEDGTWRIVRYMAYPADP